MKNAGFIPVKTVNIHKLLAFQCGIIWADYFQTKIWVCRKTRNAAIPTNKSTEVMSFVALRVTKAKDIIGRLYCSSLYWLNHLMLANILRWGQGIENDIKALIFYNFPRISQRSLLV